MSIFKHFTPKNTRFAIYAGNPGFSNNRTSITSRQTVIVGGNFI